MALKFREFEKKDIEPVFVMCRELFNESPNYRDKVFSEKKARALLSQILTAWVSPMLGLVVEDDTGQLVAMLGAAITEDLITDDKTSVDILLYIHPDHRGGALVVPMVKYYEAWALARGVKLENIKLGVSSGIGMERTVRIYERLGYRLMSYSLAKERAP